ncbi:MAG: ABC transporter permease [bacterium]|nr:ABC transporter permease [bacterium]
MSEFFGKVRTGLGTTWRSLPILPLLIVLLAVAAALLADLIAPHGPDELNLAHARQGWVFSEGGSWQFPLGTDSLGRDILSRLIKGAQVSMAVAAGTVLLAGSIGTTLGIIAGYFGGWVDTVIMRLVDGWLAFPAILIALVFAVIVGPSVTVVVSVMALILWARYARLIRGEVLSLKERDFIALARVAGGSPLRIMASHLLPNVLNSVIVLSTLQIGWAITVEATLSFLGAGVPPPTPTWGGMVADGRDLIRSAWWISVFPGAAIGLVVLSFNLIGDRIRDLLDPKLRAL